MQWDGGNPSHAAAPLSTKFLGQKVSAVKWMSSQQGAKRLLTGSWDDRVNHLTLWSVPYVRNEHSEHGGHADSIEPIELSHIPMRASITSLAKGSNDREAIVSTGDGKVHVVDILHGSTLEIRHTWDGLHTAGCACTALETRSPDFKIASAGEDGRIHILHLDQGEPVRTWGDGFGATVNDVAFRSQSEFFSVNSMAQLQLWDVREKGVVNTFRFENSADDGALQELHSVCVHEQGNKVATGDNCGVLNIWDMRMAATELVEFPESSVQCHTSELWNIQFHPIHTDHVFTASEDGKLLWWNTNPHDEHQQDFYLPSDAGKLNVRDLINEPYGLGVNSIDVEMN